MAFWGKNQINGQPGQRPMPNVTARNGGGPQAPAQQPAAAPQAAPKKNSLVDSFNQLLFLKKKNPVMDIATKLCDLILEHAVVERTSDIHIESQGINVRVRFRVDGILNDMLVFQKTPDIPLVQRIRVLAGFDPEPSTAFKQEDGRFQKIVSGRGIQLRVSSFPTVNGEKIVMRVVDRAQLSIDLDKLGLMPDTLGLVRRLIKNPYGMLFLTGDTGSGKTTTLYAILKEINMPSVNIITLEDPVEYRMEGINQAQIEPKRGFSWKEALVSILRQDPNVIMIGEVRDFETAEMSMRFALTGHLLFTTIHTISAPSTIERLFEMGVPPFLIASSMLGAMSQRLVRRLCPYCSKPASALTEPAVNEFTKNMDLEEAKIVKQLILSPGANFKIPNLAGCPNCRNGYRGRIGLFELMVMNESIRKHVLANAPTDVIRRTAINTAGMRTLLMDGILKARLGETSLAEVIRVTATMV